MKLYFIKHAPTGGYLPEPAGRQGRGGSHVEPVDANVTAPRIFRSERAAKIALNFWLKGKHMHSSGVYHDYEGNPDYWEETEIVPVPTRRREDMAIVERTIEL